MMIMYYLLATSRFADRISVWKSGASADTSHLYSPDVSRSTPVNVTSREFDLETCNKNVDKIKR